MHTIYNGYQLLIDASTGVIQSQQICTAASASSIIDGIAIDCQYGGSHCNMSPSQYNGNTQCILHYRRMNATKK